MSKSILEKQMKNNPLIYRDKLTIPDNINFGLELELDMVKYDKVYKLVRNKFGTNWNIKIDRSLTLNESAEITSPILQNNKQTWILLKRMGELLNKINPSYDKCSFQVNFDGSLLPRDVDKVNFLKLYAMYEDIIYRFSKGDDIEYRESLDTYAYPIVLELKGMMNCNHDEILDTFFNEKKYGIAFKNVKKDLIEFRTPNMTSNPILWQNYITTFYYLISFATSNKYDKIDVEQYINNFYRAHLLEDYEIEKKNKALQFVKSIFPYHVDQYSFMHQYLQTNKCK